MPTCRKCNLDLPVTTFTVNKSYKSGKATICKPCSAKWQKEYRKNNEFKYKASKFKTSQSTIETLFSKINYCQICNQTDSRRKLSIDHDHVTGKIRGLLCDACNKGLGLFKDNKDLLENAKNYLESHNGK